MPCIGASNNQVLQNNNNNNNSYYYYYYYTIDVRRTRVWRWYQWFMGGVCVSQQRHNTSVQVIIGITLY